MPIDIPFQLGLLRDACVSLRDEAYCTPTVVQAIGAIARHETGFGSYKPFAKPATSTEPAFESFNYGAQQCGKVADKNGLCPDKCFPARDTSPTSVGTSVSYLGCFIVHDNPEAGALSLVKLLTVSRPGIAAALPSGDLQVIAQSMRDAKYFEGFGATQRERVRNYAVALERNGRINAAQAHVANLLVLPPEPAPEPPADAVDGLAAGFTAAAMTAALLARILRGSTATDD